ncbi:MAG: hypothetical protein FWD40_01855 [Treponema sp.]|nr:hypothetical protein [Treponema sp.]
MPFEVMQIKVYLLILFLCFASCDNNDINNNGQTSEIQTVMVTFVNTSSYKTIVHRDSFYGPIITEVNTINRSAAVPVRVNDDYNLTVFSIEYIIYPVNDDFNNEYADVFASCYDPDIQIATAVKAGLPITIQIPQPSNLICKSAFIRIINNYELPVHLRYAGRNIFQANNILPIAPYQQGLYKLDNNPDEGVHCQHYNMATAFGSVNFSDFIEENDQYITKNAFIYYFIFNGNTITRFGEPRALIFN